MTDTAEDTFSSQYWKTRYAKGGTSGAGSYGRLAQYKAQMINAIAAYHGIESAIEFGMGDGNQARLFEFDRFIGTDIVPQVIDAARVEFADRPNWSFKTNDDFDAAPERAELCLSLDVIYHLLEDEVFEDYMTRMAAASKRYLLIYSSDRGDGGGARHVKHRNYSKWLAQNTDFREIKAWDNPHAYSPGKSPKDTSFAAFKLFEKVAKTPARARSTVIRGHMASYPARAGIVELAVASVIDQIDHLHLVLNEFDAVPESLAKMDKLTVILPDEDLKDVGKFLPEAGPDDHVFLLDDDIRYAPDHVSLTMDNAARIGLQNRVFGYHGSRYPEGGTTVQNRDRFPMNIRYLEARRVDQLGTGTVYALGRNIPAFAYMASSQKFTDVRFAHWVYEQGLEAWSLPRRKGRFPSLLGEGGTDPDDTIADTFTLNWPQHVRDEVAIYAGRAPDITFSYA